MLEAQPPEQMHATGSAPPEQIDTADATMPPEQVDTPDAANREDARAAIATELRDAHRARGRRHLEPGDTLFMHGALYKGPMRRPKVLWKSDKKPRSDHDASDWLTATEFEDQPEVARCKVAQLAELMRLSRHTVVYSGAGISASAVGQAARSGTNTVGFSGGEHYAQPTPTHHALAALGRTGWVHGWVQQNHDGLPQKAGFPQEAICEVHGSWYDPSNPVVKYCGSLKDHEEQWMQRETEAADLVLVIGTSLGGLYADETATTCCERAAAGASLGGVIINLQQTDEDGKMTLSCKGKSDNVLQLLLAELGLPPLDPRKSSAVIWPEVTCALVPYDARGRRLPEGSTAPRMWLDLRLGAKIKLTAGHNHQGAKQPSTMHVGARKGQKFHGEALRNVGPGRGSVLKRDDPTSSIRLIIEGAPMKLGAWWMDAAMRGGPEILPIVNTEPLFEDSPDPSAGGRGERPPAAAKRKPAVTKSCK